LDLSTAVRQHNWFHAMNLGDGVVTPGRFNKDTPPNFTIFPVYRFLENIDLTGLECLDIGATDGINSFIMKQERAAKVVATDRGFRPTFELVREHLGLDVDYLPRTTLDGGNIKRTLSERGLPVKYDVVLLAGVIYHAYDPLVVLMHARSLLKRNGLLIVETAFAPGKEAALVFNSEAPTPVPEPNTYFLPTAAGTEAMLRFISTNPLATITNRHRLAVLSQACRPSEIEGATGMLRLIIEKGSCYGPLRFDALQSDTSEPSKVILRR